MYLLITKKFRTSYSHMSVKRHPRNLTMIPEHISVTGNKCRKQQSHISLLRRIMILMAFTG